MQSTLFKFRNVALYLLLLSLFLATSSVHLHALEKQEETIEEIIIERDGKKNDGKGNIILEISDDDVLVNGKPLEEYITLGLKLRRKPRKKKYSGHYYDHCNRDCKHKQGAYLGVVSKALEEKDGALLAEVTPNTAAYEAGLKKGDVILMLDGRKVTKRDDLGKVVKSFDIGSTVKITYLRDGVRETTNATLRAWHPTGRLKGAIVGNMEHLIDEGEFRTFMDDILYRSRSKVPGTKIGLSVESREVGKGLKVSKVEDGSTADKAGIKEDDIILKVGENQVNTIRYFAEKVKQHKIKREPLEISIQRGSSKKMITLNIPRPIRKATF